MQIVEIIKYDEDKSNHIFVYKFEKEDFSTMSQLIVHESQEAILFRNGQALDLFGPGRYTLETENIPLLKKIVNIPTGGETPFHCEVYFINKVESMDVRWGTSNPIPIKDAVYDIILPISANGQMAVQIEDSRKFLVKLVGTTRKFDHSDLTEYFRGLLMTRIKDYLSNQMVREKLTFLDVHSHLNEMSENIQDELAATFSEYGIRLVNFFINTVRVPEDDPSLIGLKKALARKAEMNIIGYNYAQERTFNVLDKAAQNEGSGSNIMGAGIGLGMGVNIGSVVGGAMGGAMGNINTQTQPQPQPAAQAVQQGDGCKKCGQPLPGNAKFCFNCGEPAIRPALESIRCPNCTKETPKGKFCLHCGQKLTGNCPNCGAELPVEAAFCLQCGQKIN